jgi:hypothetical protein
MGYWRIFCFAPAFSVFLLWVKLIAAELRGFRPKDKISFFLKCIQWWYFYVIASNGTLKSQWLLVT